VPCEFSTKWFSRYARHERIEDSSLQEAVDRAEKGLIDADLGGHVIKQRIARPGRGKSGGYRTLIAIRREDRAIFVFGFAKSEQDNIENDQLRVLKGIAEEWLAASAADLDLAVKDGALQEIMT
jgi:hypothetical protein